MRTRWLVMLGMPRKLESFEQADHEAPPTPEKLRSTQEGVSSPRVKTMNVNTDAATRAPGGERDLTARLARGECVVRLPLPRTRR